VKIQSSSGSGGLDFPAGFGFVVVSFWFLPPLRGGTKQNETKTKPN
jgi:hypothetical protein